MIEDKNPQRTSLSQLGEFGLIEHLTKNFDVKQSSTLKSIGDGLRKCYQDIILKKS